MAKRNTFRVGLAQIPIREDDVRANADQIVDAVAWAGSKDCDFLVTPESSLTGHHNRFDKRERDRELRRIGQAVREAGVTTIVGACDKRNGRSYVEQVLIGGDGRVMGRHSKTGLASIDRSWASPGKSLRVFRDRGLDFGCLVCNDLWVVPLSGAPEDPRLSLQLAEKGARVIFCSSFSGSDRRFRAMHESNVMLRAMEGHLFIVSVNAAVPGAVNAVTGIMGPDGAWILTCNRRGKQLAYADITIPSLRSLFAQEEEGFIYARRGRKKTPSL
jgi:predicted amidohydrolase